MLEVGTESELGGGVWRLWWGPLISMARNAFSSASEINFSSCDGDSSCSLDRQMIEATTFSERPRLAALRRRKCERRRRN
jgi:hypothetical protein